MTTKEKLEKALEALKHIELHTLKGESVHKIASKVYEELTTPRTETVEVKRWLHKYKVNLYSDIEPIHNLEDWVELAGRYSRPVPEPETCEGVVLGGHKDGGWVKGLPDEWVGKRVIVEVCE